MPDAPDISPRCQGKALNPWGATGGQEGPSRNAPGTNVVSPASAAIVGRTAGAWPDGIGPLNPEVAPPRRQP